MASSPSISSSSPLSYTASSPQFHHQYQPNEFLSRRRAAGATGGVFAFDRTYGYEYIWPQPPRYSLIDWMNENSSSMMTFIASVQQEHEDRVSRAEMIKRERAVDVPATDDEDDDLDKSLEVVDLRGSNFSGNVRPRPPSPHHQTRSIVPKMEDARDRFVRMSVYSDDSVSRISYTSTQLERNSGKGRGRVSTLGIKKAGGRMQSIVGKVGGKLGILGGWMSRGLVNRKSKDTKPARVDITNIVPALIDVDDSDKINRAEDVNADVLKIPEPPKRPSSCSTVNIRHGMSYPQAQQVSMSFLRLPSSPLRLPVQPPNTPKTPTTPLSFARHSIPTLPNFNESPSAKSERLSGGDANGTPERCNPLRQHPNVMTFVDEPGYQGEGLVEGTAVNGLGSDAEETSQGNEVFFGDRR